MTNEERVHDFLEHYARLAHEGKVTRLESHQVLAIILYARWLDDPQSVEPKTLGVEVHEKVKAQDRFGG